MQLLLIPLFLFSATFYPLDVYPPAVQTITRFSPLYHGVELIRSLNVGHFEISMLGNVAVLLALGVFGALLASRRVEKLLVV
jgi:lipooligosaccharide transport system permease protein